MKMARKYTIGTQKFTAKQALAIYADLSKEFGHVVEVEVDLVYVPIPSPTIGNAHPLPIPPVTCGPTDPYNWTAGRN